MTKYSEYNLEVWPNEYDTDFLTKLDCFLISEFGAARERDNWGLGGSQDITQWEYKISGHKIIVQAETYMGISLYGPQDLVNKISDRLRLSPANR